MALSDSGFKVAAGLAIGLGVLILAPAVAPAVASAVKPLIKASIKSGILLIGKAQELIAEARESIEDLAAEAHAELAQEWQQASSHVSDADVDKSKAN
jgi:hypothetical protein